MKDEGSRPTLRSFLADSGVPPEKFLEALEILRDEIRALLDEPRPRPAQAAQSLSPSENDEIRRILEDIKVRWVRQDREKSRGVEPAVPAGGAPEKPPAAPGRPPGAAPDTGRIVVETVILSGPGGGRVPPRSPAPPREAPAASEAASKPPEAPPPAADPADEQPTTYIRTTPAPAAPVPPAPPGPPPQGNEDFLLETVVKSSRGAPGAAPAKEPASPPAGPGDEDDMAKTVILRPDQVRQKGKGGPK